MRIINYRRVKKSKEMADPGLHNFLLKKIKELKLNKNSAILVLGAGKGNLDSLLLKEGFKNITSVDLNEKDYKIKGTKFYKFNLNNDFTWDNKKYDLILAVEVIEHLESTAHFIKEIKKKLKRKGIAIITTPNILRKVSRLNFCLFGRLSSFDEKALMGWGHINPIFPHILEYYLKKNKLFIIEKTYNRKDFDYIIVYSWKSYLYYITVWFLSNLIKLFSLNKEHIEGVINIYIVQNK